MSLHRFESFVPKKLDQRWDSEQGKKIKEIEKKRKEIYKSLKFEAGIPTLLYELTNRLDIDEEHVDFGAIDHSWEVELYTLNIEIYFYIRPEEDLVGFLISKPIKKKDGFYEHVTLYKGLDVDEAEQIFRKEAELQTK